MIPTIIISTVIGIIFVAIVANEIVKKKQGKPSCSCGRNCGACGLCHQNRDSSQDENGN